MNAYIVAMLSMVCVMSLHAQDVSKETALATGGVAAIPQDIITQPEVPAVLSESVSILETMAEPKVESVIEPKVEPIVMPKLEPVVSPVKPMQKPLILDVEEAKVEPALEMMPVAEVTMEKEAAEDACAVKNISGDADAMMACVEESAKEIDKKFRENA